jgi:hypothetical protein
MTTMFEKARIVRRQKQAKTNAQVKEAMQGLTPRTAKITFDMSNRTNTVVDQNKNARIKAVAMVSDLLESFDLPSRAKFEYLGMVKEATSKDGTIEDGIVKIGAVIQTLMGHKLSIDIPVIIKKKSLLEPAVFFYDGAPYILCRPALDQLVKRGTLNKEVQQKRNLYSPPPMEQWQAIDHEPARMPILNRDHMFNPGSRNPWKFRRYSQTQGALKDVWQQTHEKMPDHAKTLLGERPAGSQWGGEGFAEHHIDLPWEDVTEKTPENVRFPGAKYYHIPHETRMQHFPKSSVGAIPLNEFPQELLGKIQLTQGAHGKEMQIREEDVSPEFTKKHEETGAHVITGPEDFGDAVWTAHPGPIMSPLPRDFDGDINKLFAQGKPFAVKVVKAPKTDKTASPMIPKDPEKVKELTKNKPKENLRPWEDKPVELAGSHPKIYNETMADETKIVPIEEIMDKDGTMGITKYSDGAIIYWGQNHNSEGTKPDGSAISKQEFRSLPTTHPYWSGWRDEYADKQRLLTDAETMELEHHLYGTAKTAEDRERTNIDTPTETPELWKGDVAEEVLDPAERDRSDIWQVGDEVSVTKNFEVRERGGGQVIIPSGEKGKIIRNIDGTGLCFVVEFPEMDLTANEVPARFLKSAALNLKPDTAEIYEISPGQYVMYHTYSEHPGLAWETFSDDPGSFDPNDADEIDINTVDVSKYKLVDKHDFRGAPGTTAPDGTVATRTAVATVDQVKHEIREMLREGYPTVDIRAAVEKKYPEHAPEALRGL